MGRSVSTPTHTINVEYFDVTWMGYRNDVDAYGNDQLTDDNTNIPIYNEDFFIDDWDDWVEYIKDSLTGRYKSLADRVSREWIGREDRVILQNGHCYIGVSEYCGLACVWMVNRYDYDDDCYPNFYTERNLAQSWCERVGESFRTVLKPDLQHIGGFSNGEQIFKRVEN